jgi:xanthine dehydrogenase accessory factor
MLIDQHGNWWGGISGGCLEGDLLKKAQLAMRQQSIKNISYDTRGDDPFQLGIGLGCQGLIEIIIDPIRDHLVKISKHLNDCLLSGESKVLQSKWQGENFEIEVLNTKLEGSYTHVGDLQLFTERIPANIRLWIVGNQFDANSLIHLCHQLAWEIHWVGNTLKMNAAVKKLVNCCYDWSDDLAIRANDNLVLMTHDLDKDVAFLAKHETNLFKYVGILGPSKRFDRIIKQIPSLQVNAISSPIGLDIGAEGPDEIAVSIVAEILAVKNGRNGQSLRFRQGSIHT